MDSLRSGQDNIGMMVARRAHYAGRVQGVGFRFRVLGLARRFPVSGYVRNLPDGTVELIAQGDEVALVAFLQAVREVMAANIQSETSEAIQPGEYCGFSIKH